MNIPEFSTTELIEVLPPYQQELLKDILMEHTETEAIDLWIKATGPELTTSFGGTKNIDYLKHFKNEFNKFILEDESYKSNINELKEHIGITKYFIVSFLSSALAEKLGVAAGSIAPLIVLFLGLIGKIGLNAYKAQIKNID